MNPDPRNIKVRGSGWVSGVVTLTAQPAVRLLLFAQPRALASLWAKAAEINPNAKTIAKAFLIILTYLHITSSAKASTIL